MLKDRRGRYICECMFEHYATVRSKVLLIRLYGVSVLLYHDLITMSHHARVHVQM